MSQYTLNGKNPKLSATCGHDRTLRNFFLNVRQDGEVIYSSLSEPRGGLGLDDLETKLQEHDLPMPAALKAQLTLDLHGVNRSNNTGSFSTEVQL